MEKRFLKKIRDNIPDSAKMLLGPAFRRALLGNAIFRETYARLIEREQLGPEEIERIRMEQLRGILQYADQYVPYYNRIFREAGFDAARFNHPDQLRAIPYLTRDLIRENYDSLISTAPVKGGHYIATTGGSSGIPLQVLLDYESVYKENAFIYYYRRKLGFGFEDRVATFRGVDFGKKCWKRNPMQNELLFSPVRLSRLTVRDYVRRIDAFAPDFLNGYISALWYLARLMAAENLRLRKPLRGIFLMSESVDPEQRAVVEEFFGARTITHYGHSERVLLAEEKAPGEYYFDPYYGYAELVPGDEGKLAIVGTGFLTRTMPLIRYRTDDYCTPGKGGFIMQGKRDSRLGLYGRQGEFISSASFDLEDEVFKNILNYQFIQRERGKAELLLVVNKDFDGRELEKVKRALKEKTRQVLDFDIRVVDHLLLSPRGKCEMYHVHLEEATGAIPALS